MLITLLVAAVFLSAGLAAYVVYSNLHGSALRVFDTVEMGDLVEVNYVGRLPDGRVFDTSILAVAADDALYPKSLTFSRRANDSYRPLTMTAGAYGEAGTTIKGFALGVLGMRKGETRVIEVTPEDGYPLNPTMIVTIDTHQQVQAMETMDEAQFKSKFGFDPILMSTIPHYFWGWKVLIVENVGGMVKFRHEPSVGMVVTPFGDPKDPYDPRGWYCTVESYDPSADGGTGMVVVRHHISQEDVYFVRGLYEDGRTFVLWDYDSAAGTFQIHMSNENTGYNGEIFGRTLYFEVTIVSFVSF